MKQIHTFILVLAPLIGLLLVIVEAVFLGISIDPALLFANAVLALLMGTSISWLYLAVRDKARNGVI